MDQYSDTQALDTAIDALQLKGGNKRYTGQSIAKAYSSVFQITGRRGLVPRVLVAVTTGKSDDDVSLVGQNLKTQKIISIVVSVGENVDEIQGNELATSPAHNFVQDDVANLPGVVEDIVDRINKGMMLYVLCCVVFYACCVVLCVASCCSVTLS